VFHPKSCGANSAALKLQKFMRKGCGLYGRFFIGGFIVAMNSRKMMSNCKRRGEWAELQFMAKAAKFGLRISKPWGEMARYDMVIDAGGRFVRVQIKSTISKRSGGLYYLCGLRTGNAEKPYQRGEFDFVAAYIIPEDTWYIIPAKLVVTGKMRAILLFPSSPTSKYGAYKEAWELLR
jgi:hypothetical protein